MALAQVQVPISLPHSLFAVWRAVQTDVPWGELVTKLGLCESDV